MENHFFNYDEFVEEYIQDPDKKEGIEKYEEKFHIGRNSLIENHPFYKHHLANFNADFEIILPPEVDMNPQEKNLLAKLIFGSLSSRYLITLDDEWKNNPIGKPKVNLSISVTSEGESIMKTLSELYEFQIRRLFEIYVNEQINIFLLWQEENEDYDWTEEHDDIGLEVEGKDYESWKVKQEQEERYMIFNRQAEQIMSEAKFYLKLHTFLYDIKNRVP